MKLRVLIALLSASVVFGQDEGGEAVAEGEEVEEIEQVEEDLEEVAP